MANVHKHCEAPGERATGRDPISRRPILKWIGRVHKLRKGRPSAGTKQMRDLEKIGIWPKGVAFEGFIGTQMLAAIDWPGVLS